MKYNLYQLSVEDSNIKFIKVEGIKSQVDKLLGEIEGQITEEFLKKQEGKIGIDSLGNELRYNKTLKSIFGKKLEKNITLIKLTENRRSFLRVFIDSVLDNKDNEVFFFIFEDMFGQKSKLVDPSFIRKKEIEEELIKLFQITKPKFNTKKIFFIEMHGFDNYIIEEIKENKGYSKLIQNG